MGTIWCVGRNFKGHIKELKNEEFPTPLIFQKSSGAVLLNSPVLEIPSWCEEVQGELELAFRFNDQLKLRHVGLALDLTERRLQATLKERKWPWSLAKSFDRSCPLTTMIPLDRLEKGTDFTFSLTKNGTLTQTGHSRDMIYPVWLLAEYVRTYFPVQPGDYLLTGTPEGVSSFQEGDLIEVELAGFTRHSWKVSKYKALINPTPHPLSEEVWEYLRRDS